VWSVLRGNPIYVLLLLTPVAVVLEGIHANPILVFGVTALAIIPMAGLIGEATEELAAHTGPGIGGLLNATFGNATELIIALLALAAGLEEVVKASITGSILGNLLLVLGLSMLVGGLGRSRQAFNRTSAGASSAMLFLSVISLVMPAVFDWGVFGSLAPHAGPIDQLSLLVAGVLALVYLASLVFSLVTHRDLFSTAGEHRARIAVRPALLLLLLATAVTAVLAEFLVGSIAATTRQLGITEFFVGVVVVAIVGNAAEHFSAVIFARKNQMDLAVTIAVGSSTQIALFVAPVLVFASLILGRPMSLVFNIFEIMAVTLAVLVVGIVSLDGESNWFEGLQLLAVYAIMAIIFFFVPAAATGVVGGH